MLKVAPDSNYERKYKSCLHPEVKCVYAEGSRIFPDISAVDTHQIMMILNRKK